MEDKQFELEFNIQMEQWIKTKDIMKENEMKAAALTWKYCSTQIQVRVQAHRTYAVVREDPITLLELIKHMMHDPEIATFFFATILNSLFFVICKLCSLCFVISF